MKLYLNYFVESVDEGDRHTEIEKYDDGNDYVFIADLLEKLDSTGATINFECTYNEGFVLRVFAELSFADISEIFGKSESWLLPC